ncbi:hypothetical protein QSJ18_04150 [Gordonia sp. ABSL1-1]|uniref:hypothetical protein n=1 Tax=Gordonia sp. ABSL1-1 TaxID=3053923 RepID=UPI002573FDF8|nr:hypothetical protein [Gordonia sp. ABSL1-1]MDL9935931.1 hypothetical protein [Gordonia sp. ABSL1-1]
MSPFSDDDLAAYYREIEWRTAANEPVRRRGPTPIHRSVRGRDSDEGSGRGRGDRSDRRRQPCPTPDKVAYTDPAQVREAIDYGRRYRRSGVELRSYLCRCGCWHITSSPRLSEDESARGRRPRHIPQRGKGKKKR